MRQDDPTTGGSSGSQPPLGAVRLLGSCYSCAFEDEVHGAREHLAAIQREMGNILAHTAPPPIVITKDKLE